MSTLGWIKKKIDNVKAESGEAWSARSISANAGDVAKLLAFVDAFDKMAEWQDISTAITKDVFLARAALDEETK